jgi:NAD(P)-dependent dehydrogenase (short-subunit alcohol dehydrogenase family)
MSILSSLEGVSSTVFSNIFIHLPQPEGDLTGQTIIVSGSNQGLGLEASRHLLRLGVKQLIMAVRDLNKGETARQELLQSTGREDSSIEVWKLDMDQYTSVKDFAARAETLPRLDALLANAGLATNDFGLSEENERTITVNVVSAFLLIALLIPKLRESAVKFNIVPRVSIPNSALHYIAPLGELQSEKGGIFDSLNNRETANMTARYPLSKLLVLFGVRGLATRLTQNEGPLVVINTPNPSFCKSQLLRETDNVGLRVGERLLARSTEEGSRALVHGILADEKSHGQYLTNCQVHRFVVTYFGSSSEMCQLTMLYSPSCVVTDRKGVMIQKAFFTELVTKLEQIVPGVTSKL